MPGARPPEFGPNGAVINAPEMTDEMRAKIAEQARRGGASFSVAVNIAVATAMGGALLLRMREPLAAIALAAVGSCLALGLAAWRLARRNGPKSP